MKNSLVKALTGICFLLTITLVFSAHAHGKTIYTFGGGPAGGTFQFMAGGISTYKPVKDIKEFRVLAKASAGSVENLRKVNSGKYAMGVVYSGHVYQGLNGMMKKDPKKYKNVLAVSYFYGAPAQLVVRRGAGFKEAMDLVGRKVGVGNAGSGAFANCELFFNHLGIWNNVQRNAMGYNDAANAFGNHQLDAFWLFTAFPSGAVLMAAQTNNIDLIDLYSAAEKSGFLKKYPYFSKTVIPAGTYKGVDHDTASFQDSTLWVANKDVPAEVVYTLLSIMYSDEGLAHMRNVKKTAQAMSIESGINGIVTPLHPGAEKFWKEKGVL